MHVQTREERLTRKARVKSRPAQWETSVNCSPRLLIPALKNRSFSHSECADCPQRMVLSMCMALDSFQGWGSPLHSARL